jgi:hypothetical protein
MYWLAHSVHVWPAGGLKTSKTLKRGERGEREEGAHQSAHKLLEQDRRETFRTYLELRLEATAGQPVKLGRDDRT